MVGVLQILSRVLGALAFALLVPAAIALAGDEGTAENFLVVAGLVGFLAGGIFFALRGRHRGTSRADRFVLVVIAWTAVPAIAALPIMLSTGTTYLASLFEATSGFTTTGATVFTSLADVDPAVIFWRAELQWLGGLATLFTFALVLAPAGLGGVSGRGLALIGGFGESATGRMGHIMRTISAIYVTASGLCIVLLFVGGVPTFDAVCLAFATVSTGGFMPFDGTISTYGNGFARVVIPVFMLIGATGVTWQRMLFDGRWSLLAEHRETYWVIGIALVAGVAYAIVFSGFGNVAAALGEGLFTGVSIVSTTGFETRPAGLAALPDSVVIALAFAGGASLSTAGGIKFYRIGAMIVQAWHELTRVIFPHSVRTTRFGSQPYDLQMMKAIWVFLGLSLAVVIIAAVSLALALPTFDAAIIAAVAAFANIGPLYSPEWPNAADWPTYAGMADWAKLVLMVTMILGRLEVIVAFAAISAAWRS